MHAVIVGAPMEQQTVVGPFESFDAADMWCVENLKNQEFTWIITVVAPDQWGK